MSDSDLCFDVWTIRRVPKDDFGMNFYDNAARGFSDGRGYNQQWNGDDESEHHHHRRH